VRERLDILTELVLPKGTDFPLLLLPAGRVRWH
jgi:hypothetical protein